MGDLDKPRSHWQAFVDGAEKVLSFVLFGTVFIR
jgi:hypothetical protein